MDIKPDAIITLAMVGEDMQCNVLTDDGADQQIVTFAGWLGRGMDSLMQQFVAQCAAEVAAGRSNGATRILLS